MRTEDGQWTWRYDRALRGPSALPARDTEAGWRACANISVPAQLIRGEFSDILSPAIAKRMMATIPDLRFDEVKDSGHPVPLDAPLGPLDPLLCPMPPLDTKLPEDAVPPEPPWPAPPTAPVPPGDPLYEAASGTEQSTSNAAVIGGGSLVAPATCAAMEIDRWVRGHYPRKSGEKSRIVPGSRSGEPYDRVGP
jgi:hypothetical protein